MDYEGLLKDIGDATNLQKLIEAKVSEQGKVSSQITENETEMARLKGLVRITDNLKSNSDSLLKDIAGLNSELSKRMKKLKEANVELPLYGDSPKGIVRP